MTGSIVRYLEKITTEHKEAPNFVAVLTIYLQTLADNAELIESFPSLFDIDFAVGVQLDAVGVRVGRNRFVQIPNVYFSLDVDGLGLDQGWLQGQFDPPTYLTRLDDDHYRMLLYAIVALNQWNGSVDQAYEIWDTLFQGKPKVLLQDWGHMTMFQAILPGTEPLDAVSMALFTNGEILLKPEGVQLEYFIVQNTPNTPLFGLGVQNDSVAGLDTGAFGVETLGV